MTKRIFRASLALAWLFAFGGVSEAAQPYLGVGFGAYNLGNGVVKQTTGGGYLQVGDDFSDHLGGELRIGKTGKTGEEFPPQPSMGIDYFVGAFLKPRYEFNDQLTGYALLGVATLRASYSEPGFAVQKKTRTGYAYGLGVQYRFSDGFSVGAEFSHMLSKPKTNAQAIKTNFQGVESNAFSLSLKYHLF